MARSAALGFALAGAGAVAIISGIQGKSIANVLKGELGESPNPAFGKKPTVSIEGETGAEGKEGNAGGETGVSGELNAIGEPLSGKALAESGNAPLSPAQAANQNLAGTRKREELNFNTHNALVFAEKLSKEVSNKRITPREAESIFGKAYPNFSKEFKEFAGHPPTFTGKF